MKIYKIDLNSTDDITREIVRLICKFSHRIEFMNKYSLNTVYRYLCNVRYSRDKAYNEYIVSPDKGIKLSSADCKKKHIILGSYCKNNKIPFRIVLSSTRKDGEFHHIFIQCLIDNVWVNHDCTYNTNWIGKPNRGTKFKFIVMEC